MLGREVRSMVPTRPRRPRLIFCPRISAFLTMSTTSCVASWNSPSWVRTTSALPSELGPLCQRRTSHSILKRLTAGTKANLGLGSGWFSNRLRGYPDTFNLKCQVHPRSGRRRPYIQLEPIDHPLVREQRNGITFDRLLEIYAIHGHDLQAALTNLD